MNLIERYFPVELLNPIALNEGNSKRPIYRMHKWWARRLGSVFRAITLTALSGEEESEEEVWRKFSEGADLKGKIVLDPFVGGGTTVVEASRLGCKVIGSDINPVAWFVTKKEIESVDLDLLDKEFHNLEQTAGKQIKDHYSTTCPHGHDASVMYFFWVKVANCHKCGVKILLFPSYELSIQKTSKICVCPECLQIIETDRSSENVKCYECGALFDPSRGVSGRGVFRCHCGEEQKILEAVQIKGTALDTEMHALEGYCKSCGRFFKRTDNGDFSRWQKAKAEFELGRSNLLVPHQAIPTVGRSDPRPVNHGYTYFWQMFNERQLLCLSTLLEQILKIEDQNIRELMVTAFSDSLNTNNMFCKYEVDWHKISLLFSLHAFHPIERPTENNVWGTEFGRGTFVKCFEKVKKAKVYGQRPYERLVDNKGKRYSKRTGTERIEGQLVTSFGELTDVDRAVLLRCQSSENLSFVPDKSVDAVITDPPYFDNIQYSELADFFYVWLRLALKNTYSSFEPELSSRAEEIVKNDKMGKTTGFFNESLQRVFTECHRVLKDQGLLCFTFHHNKTWAWEGMGQLLLNAGFYVSATPIIRSEGRGEVHSSEGNIRYDCILVCRKKPSSYANREQLYLKDAILDDALLWARRTLESGMSIGEVDVFTIIMGKTIEYYTKAFANGKHKYQTEVAPLKDFLEEMAELSGSVDEKAKSNSINPSNSEKVAQLRLFVMESQNKYGNK